MKAIICEMCGSNSLVKENGYFACQSCGTKYSLEEAKKLLVELQGTVSIDRSDELSSLRKLADRTREEQNWSKAAKYYDDIIRIDPDDWKAIFYSSFCLALSSMDRNHLAMISSFKTIFKLIREKNGDDYRASEADLKWVTDELAVLMEFIGKICAEKLYSVAPRLTLKTVSEAEIATVRKRYSELADIAMLIVYKCGDAILEVFGAEQRHRAVVCYKYAVGWYAFLHNKAAGRHRMNKDIAKQYVRIIQSYDRDYITPNALKFSLF